MKVTKKNFFRNIFWAIILGCIFFRPFIFEKTMSIAVLRWSAVFIIASLIYLFNTPAKSPIFLDKMVFIFFLIIIVSALASPYKNFIYLLQYTTLFLLYYMARISQEKNTILMIVIISAICVSLYSLYGLFYICPYTLKYMQQHNVNYPFAKEFLERNRAFYPFMSPNLLAGYLIMVIMICAGIIANKAKEKGLSFYVYLFCLSIGVVVLFFTKSVGGGFIFIICVFLFFLRTKLLNKKTLVLLLLLIIMLNVIIALRIKSHHYFTSPLFSASKRITYWKETANVILSHPFLGVGIGNFSLKESRTAHNSYLQVWAETGISGIIVWLAIVFVFIKNGVTNIALEKEKHLLTGIFIGGISFLLHNLIDFSFFIGQVAFLWWIILGLFLNHLQSISLKEEENSLRL